MPSLRLVSVYYRHTVATVSARARLSFFSACVLIRPFTLRRLVIYYAGDKIIKGFAMKKILLALFLIAAAVIVSGAEIIGQVVGVSDGDTITILDNLDKGRFRVRLYGIDAPEKRQAFGNKAKGYLSGLIFGKQVTVRYSSIDRYGRIVGRIYLDKKDIALAMLSAGYAWHYVHFDKSPEYAAAEKKARAGRLGLWSDTSAVPPWDFRQSSKRK